MEYIAPITVFEYADVPRKLYGAAFSNAPVKKDGKEVSYSFVDLPEVLSSLKLSDDGTVSSEPGVELPHGQYTVTVRAQNVKGFKDAQFTIDIANFTYVLWGNNLGTDGEPLTPKSKYGNQFRLEAVSNNSLVIELDEAEHDIPEGYDVHFSIVGDDGVSGISVDDSGKLTFKVNATSTRLLYRTVQVEVSDQDYTIRRRIPVFLDRYSKSTCKVMYTPFVYRVNPRTGGLSDCEITFSDGASPAYMDIYKELAYYNLDGPESHEYNGVFKNELLKTSFLHFVWDRYYTDMGASIPGNMSNNPVSYNKNQSAGTLNKAAAYVDPTAGYQIRVNPGKFKDTEGNYADGVMKTYFTFDSSESKGPDRVIIWFDSTYNQENSSVTE